MHYQARYYDPTIGRFISPDTIVQDPADPQALNRYTYVLNSPTSHDDPTGRTARKKGVRFRGCNITETCNDNLAETKWLYDDETVRQLGPVSHLLPSAVRNRPDASSSFEDDLEDLADAATLAGGIGMATRPESGLVCVGATAVFTFGVALNGGIEVVQLFRECQDLDRGCAAGTLVFVGEVTAGLVKSSLQAPIGAIDAFIDIFSDEWFDESEPLPTWPIRPVPSKDGNRPQ